MTLAVERLFGLSQLPPQHDRRPPILETHQHVSIRAAYRLAVGTAHGSTALIAQVAIGEAVASVDVVCHRAASRPASVGL